MHVNRMAVVFFGKVAAIRFTCISLRERCQPFGGIARSKAFLHEKSERTWRSHHREQPASRDAETASGKRGKVRTGRIAPRRRSSELELEHEHEPRALSIQS